MQRHLGVDWGSKRIGIAVSDDAGRIAFPKRTIPNGRNAAAEVARAAAAEHAVAIVIGDTRTLSGAENPVTKEAEEFAERVAAHTDVPVKRQWEAWSSYEASRYAPEGVKDDAAAAAIILQRYLDMRMGAIG